MNPCPSATGRTNNTDPHKTGALHSTIQPLAGICIPPETCNKKGSDEAGTHMADEGRNPKRGAGCLLGGATCPQSAQLLQIQPGMVAAASVRGKEAPSQERTAEAHLDLPGPGIGVTLPFIQGLHSSCLILSLLFPSFFA